MSGPAERLLARPPLTGEAVGALAPERLFRLDGRVALVTGGGGEIGGWLAAGLGAAGARVILVDVDAPALERTAAALRAGGLEASALVQDVAAPGGPERCVTQAVEAHGRLDVLVNAAAINRREPLLAVTPETYDAIMAVDLRAPYFLAQAAARAMATGGRGGAIVNVGSITVAVGLQGVSVYAAAKAALAELTRVMAVEWSAAGIRVNCLCPGFMATRLSEPVWHDAHRREWLLARTPQRRPGRPDELVGLLLLMASDAGSYLTGQSVFVDGGFLAGSPWDEDQTAVMPPSTGKIPPVA